MKTTFIDQALVNAANPMDVGLQGHWHNPLGPMPVKYMRRRLDGPVRMVKEMCEKERQPWPPAGLQLGMSATQALQGNACVHMFRENAERSLCGRCSVQALAVVASASMEETCNRCRAQA
jgi:hypothetical protein